MKKNLVTKNSTKHFFWWKEKNYGEKILLVKKIFLEKEFSLKKNSWKNLQVENILAKKKFLLKKNLVKIFSGKQNFWWKKISDKKKSGETNFCWKLKFVVKKNSLWTNFL